MVPSPSSKFYLPQLDGLRFLAFFLVFLHHSPDASVYFKENPVMFFITQKLNNFGWIGVDIFLCLSSFLLTTLLMLEHQKTGNLSIKQFFIRRSLRIWPLYYLILLLAFVIFPLLNIALLSPVDYKLFVKDHLLPFSIFLGNFSYFQHTSSLTMVIMPLWTVSLEEQFYLFWPILLFLLLPRNRKWFFLILLAMVFFSFLVRIYITVNNIPYPTIWTFSLARLDPFALGALVSYFYLKDWNFSAQALKFKKYYPRVAFWLAIFLLWLAVTSTGLGGSNTPWQLLVIDIACALLIYAALYAPLLSKIFSIRPFPWLGKISFGLYVFHFFIFFVVSINILPHFEKHLTWWRPSLLIWFFSSAVVFILTLLCAVVSYYGYEKHFLKFKSRFTKVASRPI